MRVCVSPGRRRSSARSGFSLVEMAASMAIFMVVGYVFTCAVSLGSGSQRLVLRAAQENENLRAACRQLRSELKATSDAMVEIRELADGNNQLLLQVPTVVEGAEVWGVSEKALGPDEVTRNVAGWSVCYTVDSDREKYGDPDRRLVRQIVDEEGVVRWEEALVKGVQGGFEDPPGFAVVQNGDMWVVTVSTTARNEGSRGRTTQFHVNTRN